MNTQAKTYKTYNSWHSMIERCYSEKHPSFKYYGARGIKVCERWKGLSEALQANEEYSQLLIDELNEVVPLAAVHHWKSNRFEQGERLRAKIKALTKPT